MVDRREFLGALGLGAVAIAVTPIGVLTDKPRLHMFGCEVYLSQILINTSSVNPIPEIENALEWQINQSVSEAGMQPHGMGVEFEVRMPMEWDNQTEHVRIRAKRYAA